MPPSLDAVLVEWDSEHRSWLIQQLQRRGFSFQDAEDVVQGAFVKAILAIRGGKPLPTKVRPWLRVITLNHGEDEREKQIREASWWIRYMETSRQNEALDPITDLIQQEAYVTLNAALAVLTPLQYEIIMRRFKDGHRNVDIAAHFSISASAVSGVVSRALRTLHAFIHQYRDDDVISE